MKIPEDDILLHAKKILELREMPPGDRQAYEAAAQNRQRLVDLESQNQYLSQSHQQVAVSARTQELDWTLQRPEVAQLVQAYDTRTGKPGSFRQAVIERGQYHALRSGQDLTPEQAMKDFLNYLGGPQSLMPAPTSQVANPGMAEKKPVITNIQGRGTSPAKKGVKSIDDLRKRAKEMAEA